MKKLVRFYEFELVVFDISESNTRTKARHVVDAASFDPRNCCRFYAWMYAWGKWDSKGARASARAGEAAGRTGYPPTVRGVSFWGEKNADHILLRFSKYFGERY